MASKFKDRYVLAEGYPNLRSAMQRVAVDPTVEWPLELRDRGVPIYRLVLERVKERSKKHGK